MKAKSSFEAIIGCKCPKCWEGNMFQHATTEKYFSNSMHSNCQQCASTFEPEPGFYFGAMYVSYAFSVAISFVSSMIIYVLVDDAPTWLYFASIIFAVVLLYPLMFRYSRSIFLHLFGGISRSDA